MSTLFAQNMKCAPQLVFDSSTGSGSYLPFSGTLIENPTHIVFDNQSSVAVTISDDGVNDWKTFASGQALVIDCAANRTETAKTLTFQIGTQFFANSSAGTGDFYISYIYAK